jgi:hypothetical protein
VADPDQLLFSYGTLQNPDVQLDTFGRLIAAEDDALPGYTVDYAEIDDPRVVDLSGLSVHPIVRPTGNVLDAGGAALGAGTGRTVEVYTP